MRVNRVELHGRIHDKRFSHLWFVSLSEPERTELIPDHIRTTIHHIPDHITTFIRMHVLEDVANLVDPPGGEITLELSTLWS